jgi:hypothetical protein
MSQAWSLPADGLSKVPQTALPPDGTAGAIGPAGEVERLDAPEDDYPASAMDVE